MNRKKYWLFIVLVLIFVIFSLFCHSQRKSYFSKNVKFLTFPISRIQNSTTFFYHKNSATNTEPKLNHSVHPKIHVAVCTLSRSKKTWKNLQNSDLFRFFLKSIYQTTKQHSNDYYITLHVGVDDDDKFWLVFSDEAVQESKQKFDMNLTIYKYRVIEKNTLPMNALMQDAKNSKADYFVRLNDDTQIITNAWVQHAIAVLRLFHPPNIGVVGPTCNQGNTRILTHDMVHRTHFDIFETYYPKELKNWYIDDWISAVYGSNRTKKMQNWVVMHHVQGGTRYQPSTFQSKMLRSLIDVGQAKLKLFLSQVDVND